MQRRMYARAKVNYVKKKKCERKHARAVIPFRTYANHESINNMNSNVTNFTLSEKKEHALAARVAHITSKSITEELRHRTCHAVHKIFVNVVCKKLHIYVQIKNIYPLSHIFFFNRVINSVIK